MDGDGKVSDIWVVYDISDHTFYLQLIFTQELSGAVEFSNLK